jgi:hypothetical protein
MKKNLIFSIMGCFLLISLLSFTPIKKNHHKPAKAQPAKFVCTAGVTNLTITSNSSSFGYVTFSWTGTGNVDHYILGGYYQGGGNISGTISSYSITIPNYSGNLLGGRFAVTAVCSDGTTGTSQNIMF